MNILSHPGPELALRIVDAQVAEQAGTLSAALDSELRNRRTFLSRNNVIRVP